MRSQSPWCCHPYSLLRHWQTYSSVAALEPWAPISGLEGVLSGRRGSLPLCSSARPPVRPELLKGRTNSCYRAADLQATNLCQCRRARLEGYHSSCILMQSKKSGPPSSRPTCDMSPRRSLFLPLQALPVSLHFRPVCKTVRQCARLLYSQKSQHRKHQMPRDQHHQRSSASLRQEIVSDRRPSLHCVLWYAPCSLLPRGASRTRSPRSLSRL
mmetsp:Transcript_33765/g.61203  ORF Transcript_33765/g.61203 Transcript_33765/m.61203 type:complete len:213 (+) Transcript_33765:336-974(+)